MDIVNKRILMPFPKESNICLGRSDFIIIIFQKFSGSFSYVLGNKMLNVYIRHSIMFPLFLKLYSQSNLIDPQ